jgi:outer membrane protein OmpU
MIAIRDAWGEKRVIPNSDSPELGTTFDTRGKTMKKVLLATTALALSAGVAHAEIALSGSAAMGVARDGLGGGAHASNDGEFHAYSTGALTATMSGASDSGLTFGAAITIATGTAYALADDDGFYDEALAGSTEVYVAGGFGKIAMKVNAAGLGQYKAYWGDSAKGYDLEYTHSMGGLSVGLRADIDDDQGTGVGETRDGRYSLNLGYAQDAVSASLAYDADGAWGASGSYTMGAITATLGTDDASVSSIKVAYAADGMSASFKTNTDSDWDLAAGYSANGMSVGVELNESNDWSATAGYDLGGGAALAAGMNSDDDAHVGMSFSF